ncbi:FeoB-associated Cys-rich membrane protein [Flavobacterium sp. M31R6]|uniref:FeoB-associated Cys-rich membrane protein n=1 Tax=Flavobacterium sp. M31R6 TaxID=2739062 RepID=UPI00353005EE
MACRTACFYEYIGLCSGIHCFSNLKIAIMIQEIIAFVILVLALAFLIRKFFFKKKSDKNCGSGDCGCS